MKRRLWIPLAGLALLAILFFLHGSPAGPGPSAPPRRIPELPPNPAAEVSTQDVPAPESHVPVSKVHAEALLSDPATVTAPRWEPPGVRVDPTVKRPAAAHPTVRPPPTSELLIFLQPGTDPAAFARDLGLALGYSLPAVPDSHVFAAATPDAAKAALKRATGDPRVARAFLNERTQHIHCAWVPNDPYYPDGTPSASFHGQWHLGNGASPNHANVVGAWNRDFTGAGVLIGIVDDCLERTHPDLSPNYVAADSWNFGNNTGDPSPNPAYDNTSNEDMHGTSVSGVAAARGGNSTGTTGAAPLGSLAGLRVDFPAQTTAMFVNATLYHSSGGNTNIKIKNHSYGVSATYIDAPAETAAVSTSAASGTIHLFAAGNERNTVSEDSNKTEPQNNPDAIAVAALGSDGKFAYYSSFGANVFVTAPSSGISGFGITTTDRQGNKGYNRNSGSGDGDAFPDLNYTSTFGGTSSATPLMSGIMALGKQARPSLDVRFAKHALARSCTQTDPTDGTVTGGGTGVAGSGTSWKTNAAGFKFNQNYGFGLVNADLFIQKLQQFSGVTPQTTESVGPVTVGVTIPDAPASPPAPAGTPGTPVSRTFTLASTTPLEEMLVTFDITHPYRGDLEAYLTSPSGTTRRLFRSVNDMGDNILWTFVTNEFWGENPAGTWTLVVQDWGPADVGTWNSFAVTARMGTVIADTTPPSVVSITRASASPTNAASISYTVTFSEPVTGADVSDFALTTTGSIAGASITSVTGSNLVYTVTVNTGSGDGTIRLDLTDDDSIQDAVGNKLGGAGAGNGSFASGQAYTLDRTAPVVTIVTSTAADGAYRVGGVVPVTVTFSENVTVTGTPQLTLATGGAGTAVNYSSGSGTATLTFTYTVGAGQNSPDLDYASTSALNGGTIRDAVGNNATLTLASPGAAGSLGANKNLVIDTTNPGAPGTPSGAPNPNNTGSFLVSWTAASDGTGSGIASYTVQRSDNGGAFNTIASGVAALSLSQTGLAQGSYRYQVRAVDVAGNTGGFSAISTPVVVDTTAPAAPSTPDLDPASDSGTSNTDNITKFTSLSFSGTAEAGATVQLFVDGVGGATTVAAGGAWTLVAPSVAAGVRSITAVATDPAGNVSPASAALSVTVDLTLPVATVPDLDPASDTGTSSTDNLTKLTTLSFSGTTEAGSTVQLFVDGVGGATTLAAGGAWTLSAASLTAGVHLFSARATDLAGNLGPLSADLSVTIDTTPPAAPSTPDLAAASDNGVSSTDNITSLTSLSFSGSAEAGSTVQLFVDGVGGATTVAAGGAWTLVAPSVAAGTHSITAVATDPAGNASPASTALSVTVDTSAPAAPSAPDLAAATDTGISNSDNVTSNLSPQFTVTGEAGGTLTLFAGAASVGTASDSGGGTYTLVINATAFANSAVVFTARITDAAGNVGALSPGLTVTFDTTAPVASVPDLDAASDTGVSSTDNLTKLTTLSFSGTAEAGSTVQLFVDGIGGATTTASGAGTWTLLSAVLGAGTHSVAAKATDAAGNIGPLSAQLFVTIDNTPPAAPSTPDLDPASDNGASNTDNITSLTSLSFSGSAEAGSTVQLFVDGIGGASTVAAGGTWTLVAPSVAAGVRSITAVATDAAGNASPASTALSVTVDTSAPAAPSAPDLAAATDTGASNSDNLTSSLSPQFTVTGEAGGTMTLFAGVTSVGTASDSGGGTYSLTINATAFANSAVVFTARITDSAGNVGALSPGLTVTFDTTAPVASVPDLDAASDTGVSSTDNLTKLTTLSFSGTSEAGSTVQLFVDGVGGATTTATAGGAWTLVALSVSAGVHSIRAQATDAAGNIGALSGPLSVTVDTTPPAAPSTPDLDAASDTGISNTDNFTSLTSLSFSGSAEAGSTVQLFVDGIGGASTVAAGGAWTLVAPVVAAGTHAITAIATDPAGNASPASTALSVTVDTSAPAAPSAPDLAAATDTGISNSDNLTSSLSPQFTVTGEAGGTMTLFAGVTSVGTASDSGGGTYTLVINATAFANSAVVFTARITDAAGNVGALSPGLTVTFDTTAPVASVPDLDAASDTGASSTDNLTNLTTLSFSGTAEAGSTVQLFVDGIGGATTTAAAGGTWTLLSPVLGAGTHSAAAQAVDAAGNLGPLSAQLFVTIDNTPPAAPSAPDLDPASDTGASNTDNITSLTSLSFSGTAEAGATVQLIVDGIGGATTTAAGGAWTLVAPSVSAGVHAIRAQATDAAGNVGALSPPLSVTVDTTAPAVPSVPDLDAASDTGASSTDNLTNATTPSFSGSAEAGVTVRLFANGVLVGTTTATAGGAYTVASSPLADGTYSFTASAGDLAGNASAASPGLSVTIDTSAPAAPSVPDLDPASDSGASNSDNLTNLATLSFSGTAEAGSTVQLLVDGTPVASGTAAGGAWTLVTPALAAGPHNVSARASDAAGNLGPASAALAVTIDLTAPAAPSVPDLDPASDSGASNSDNVTNLTTLSFSGTAEAGATVQLFVDGAPAGSVVAAAGTWTITAGPLAAGTRNITARATDAAGNSSGLSGALPVTIDLTAPLAPSAPDLDPASDTGVSNTDNLTNLTTLVFTGTAEAGTTVQLFVDGVGGATTTAAGGVWTLSAVAVVAGPHSITARASDPAGNASPASPALSITVDTSAPAAPSVPDLDAASDTGASNTDNITSLTTLSFSGTAEAGATVQLLVDGNPAGSIVAAAGTWTITAGPLTAGTHSVTARATDPAGNASAPSAALSVTIDTTLPTTLAAPDLDAASDTGASSTDNITSVTTPSFSGTAEAGATVKLFANGVQVGSAVASAGGAYTVVSSALADGIHTMTVTATDAAGNASAGSPGLAVTIDTAPPAAPSAPDLDPASDTGASATDNLTKATTLSFSGTAEAGSTVQLFVDGVGGATTTAGGGGAWTLSAAGVAEGTHAITARARDAAGNLGPASAPLSVTVDTTLPAAPSVPDLDAASDTGASSTDNITSLTTLSFSGSAEAGATVQLFVDGNPGATVVAAAGAWTLTAGPLAAGVHAVGARATDAAGNLGPASLPLSVTIDTTPPAAPSVPDLDPASDSGASNTDNITKLTTLTFTGTTEAGATVQLFVDGNPGPSVAASGTSWTIVAVLSAGVHAVTALATDAAGNAGAASAALSVTVDTTAPAAPSTPDLNAASDSGASSTDNLTNLTALSFSGSAEAGATVQLFVDGNPAGSVVAAAGTWTIVTPPLAEGAHAVTAVATDPAGNASAASGALSVTIDLTAPAAPSVPDLDAGSDSGASSTDNITKLTTLSFSGTAEPGATVRLLVDGSPVALTTAVAGTWTLSAVGVAEGVHLVTATATDAAGNASAASAPLSVTVDTTAPAAPSTPDLDAASDTGASNTDNVTSLTTLSFSGTAEAGATVQLFVDGVGGASITAAGGAWTLGAAGLAPGVRSITARATDAAGNSSVVSGVLSVTIDSGIPAAPSVPDLDPASDTGISSTDNLTKLTTLTFTGTAEAGATVRLFVDGVSAGTAVATGGAWSITASSLAPGVRTFTATALDTAGNLSPASAGLAVTIDTTPPLTPATPTLDAASDDGLSSTDAITTLHTLSFSGTAEAGSLVRLFAGATQVGSVTAGPTGDYTVVSSSLADGAWSITVTATDPAGNVSAASAPLAVIVDNSPPPAGIVFDGAGADIDFQNSATTIVAHWSGFTDPESGILKYEVAVGTTPGGQQVEGFTDVGTATSTSRGPFALVEGATYYVTVRATNPVGLTSTASSDGVKVDLTAPAPAAGFFAVPGDGSAMLHWSASPSADTAIYRAWWSTGGGPETLADNLVGTAALIPGLPNDSLVSFRLRAVDAAGNESTDVFTTTTPEPAIRIQGGGSFATIQAAIDAAAPGQTILIGPGTFVGDLVLRPGVSLQGYSPYYTILQGSGLGPVITVQGVFGSGLSSTISQLTVTGGLTGISSVSADLTVHNGVIHHVLGDGISAGAAGRLTALNVTSVSNTGDGIQSLGQTTIRDTIAGGNGAMGFNLAAAASVTYSDAWANAGGNYSSGAGAAGNLSTPAIFTNEAAFDYTTPAASPTVDAGDPADDFSGEPLPNGGRVDMGAYGNTGYAPLTTGPVTPPPPAAGGGGGGGGGGGCGLLGLDGVLLLWLLGRSRRNRPREVL